MPPRKRRYPLFSAYSLSVEHAIVDRTTLQVLPLASVVLEALASVPVAEGERHDVELAPGVAAHTLVLRNTKVMRKTPKWAHKLAVLSAQAQRILDAHNATVLSGGAHPFYVPARDASVGNGLPPEVRTVCDALFDTRKHGWSNDQGLKLGLYFDKADEFAKAHAAVRLLLPLIPGLAAASPILEGKITDAMDARLDAHFTAFARVPELVGPMVPEAVFDTDAHDRAILSPIAQALVAHDSGNVLDAHTMDARGATTQFDPGIIHLHVIDAQECPNADLAVVEFIIAVLKALVNGRWVSNYLQRAWAADELRAILLDTIKEGDQAMIGNRDYLLMFGLMQQEAMPALKVWQHLFVELYPELSPAARTHIAHILEHGTLATRIMARAGKRPTAEKLREAYAALAQSHSANAAFL